MKHKLINMEYLVSCVAFFLLFLAHIIPSEAAGGGHRQQTTAQPKTPSAVEYHGVASVRLNEPFAVSCTVGLAEPVHWTRDGRPLATVPADEATERPPRPHEYVVDESVRAGSTRVSSRLSVQRARPEHAGRYRCTPDSLRAEHHLLRVDDVNSIKPNYDFDSNKVFDIRGHLIISCNVSLAPENPYTLDWLKDGKPVSEDSTLTNRYKILSSEDKFVIDRTIETDAGNYTCKITNSTDPALSANIEVLAKPFVKLAPNTGVVEGERLRILCNVYGKPVPNVEWQIENDTYKESRDRVELLPSEAGIPNSVLLIAEAKLEDRGTYTCRATSIASRLVNATQAETFVRVKDRLAALWPFLGICTEVFVLCAIILVYEKRRSKPELDESDVDQSPDQKK